MLRHAVLKAALSGLAAARFPDWAPSVAGVQGTVLTLHHVQPSRAQAFAPNAHLSITPEFLDTLLAGLKACGARLVPLDELVSDDAPDGAHRIAVTLDDGLRDNLEHAWPVFKRHGVPFTIFVCPGFCDRTAEIWWIALERIVAGADRVSLAGEEDAPAVASRTLAEKRRAFAVWAAWLIKEVSEARQREIIRALAEGYGLDLGGLAAELVMDWDEVRTIAADPLCTIGAHTLTHPALARLADDQALREMRGSAERIEAEIGTRPTTIAFPYGYPAAAGPREARLSAEAGFAASFTTRPGTVHQSAGRQGLPRVSVNGHFQSLAAVRVLTTPGLWRARERLKGS